MLEQSKEIDRFDYGMNNITPVMIITAVLCIIDSGLGMLNGVFLIISLVLTIVYKFLWTKIDATSQSILYGFTFFIYSIAIFIIAIIVTNFQNEMLVGMLVACYVTEYLAMVYLGIRRGMKKVNTSLKYIKYSAGPVMLASSIGLILSRISGRTLSEETNLLIAGVIAIVISYLLASGARFMIYGFMDLWKKEKRG